MNYISHFYSLPSPSANATLGVLLPDIIPRFSYLHNKFFLHFDSDKLDAEERELWRGIAQHYTDDSIFHELPAFKIGMKRIENEMEKHDSLKDLRRQYLISHVLYELIIDHLLIERYPGIVGDIYKQIDGIEISTVLGFFDKIMDSKVQNDLFLNTFNRFVHRRFLNFYAIDSNLVKSLHMVSGHISQWEYNDITVHDFTSIIRKIKNEIAVDEIFENLKMRYV